MASATESAIREALAHPLTGTDFPTLGVKYEGKVRDNYTANGRRTIVRRTPVRYGAASASGSQLIRLFITYQRVMEGRPSPCRFSPSCSSYAVEALQVHGTARGLWLTIRRLARCRPFGPSGWDPVPQVAADTSSSRPSSRPSSRQDTGLYA